MAGYLFIFEQGAISWKPQLQPVVVLSSTETEYVAATEAIKEALWLQGLVNEMGLDQSMIKVFCDNQSAIHLTKNSMNHECTKHIYVKYHFIIDVVEEEKVKVEKISTEENPADMLTKPIPTQKFKQCLDFIQVLEVNP